MAGDIEFGKCDICNKEHSLERRYYRYPIKCECCNGAEDNHFEIVRHCSSCDPKPPRRISLSLKPIICPCGNPSGKVHGALSGQEERVVKICSDCNQEIKE